MKFILVLLTMLLGTQETTESLLQQMTNGRIEEREAASKELVRRGREAVPALEAATRSTDPDRAGRARLCLEKISFAERLTPRLLAIDGLAERLRRGGAREWGEVFDEALPGRAIRTYASLTAEDLCLLATEALRNASKSDAVIKIVVAVGQERLVALRPAIEALNQSSDLYVRAAVAKTLIRLAGPQGLDVAEPFLIDPLPEVRRAAVSAIGEERLTGGGARLARMTSDAEIVGDLMRAFWQLRARDGIPYLTRLCQTTQEPPPNLPIMYLSFYAGPHELPLFRGMLKRLPNYPHGADDAVRMLGRWGDRESLPVLEKAVESYRLLGDTPHAVAEALFRMGATSSFPTFLTLARKSNDGAALAYLGQMGNRDAIPGLREFLDPPVPAAIIALAELEDRESLPAIRALLAHKDKAVRGAASTALAILQDEPSIAAILPLRKEADPARRIWPALGPVVKQDSSEVDVEVLLQRLKDPYYDSERYSTSLALLRKGRREGLAEMVQIDYFFIFALNALRRPAVWEAFQKKSAPLRLYAPYQQLHERLALISGLKLEEPSEGVPERKAWTDVYSRIHRWGRPPTLAEAYEMIEDPRWSVVLEEDRIRILPFEEARLFWTRWVAGEEK